MRKSFALAAALTLAITVASPVAAAPRKDRGAEPPSISIVFKNFFKKVFGVTSNNDIIIPIPRTGN